MKNIIYLLILLVSLNGCYFSLNPMARLWFYTHSSGGDAGANQLLTPACFLELRKDGTYTRDFGKFETGTWHLEERILYLTNQQKITTAIPEQLPNMDELQLALPGGMQANFDGQPLPGNNPAEDPFSAQNNQWRIKATHKETDQELRQRLYNHCRYWEMYFTWALDKKISSVDVRSTPTLIKVYGNGLVLKPKEDLPDTWKSYFFDEEDCGKASDIIEDIFKHKNIAWAHTDNKYKLFIGAFQQLESYLK